ncbi:hypothetical protein T439DRAFT_351437 [Meredithblackwellia eburnea MCA 4105]
MQALKSAIWYTVSQIVQEEELSIGFTSSEHFVGALTETVFQQALSLGRDLESFAKTTVGVEDVKLAVRNNDSLFNLLSNEAHKHGLALSDLQVKPKSKPRAPRKPSTTTAAGKRKGKAKAEKTDDDDDDDSEEEVRARKGKQGKAKEKEKAKEAAPAKKKAVAGKATTTTTTKKKRKMVFHSDDDLEGLDSDDDDEDGGGEDVEDESDRSIDLMDLSQEEERRLSKKAKKS